VDFPPYEILGSPVPHVEIIHRDADQVTLVEGCIVYPTGLVAAISQRRRRPTGDRGVTVRTREATGAGSEVRLTTQPGTLERLFAQDERGYVATRTVRESGRVAVGPATRAALLGSLQLGEHRTDWFLWLMPLPLDERLQIEFDVAGHLHVWRIPRAAIRDAVEGWRELF